MAVPTIPYAASANGGANQVTTLTVPTANTFTELALAALCARGAISAPVATIGGSAMTLVELWNPGTPSLAMALFRYVVPGSLVNPSVVFTWTGAQRAVGLVAEINSVDELGAGAGMSDVGKSWNTNDATAEAPTVSPSASQRWVNVITNIANDGSVCTVDPDFTQHAQDVSTNGTGANNVRGTLASRVGTGAALSDVHTFSATSDGWTLYAFRLSDAAAVGAARKRNTLMIG